MSLHDETHLHHFLQNKEMNEMYISVFLMSLAQGLISIFVPIYLYSLNYSIVQILTYFFLVSLFFIILAPFLSKIIGKIGAKHSISLSIPFYIIYFLGLSILDSSPILFYVLPLLLAIRLIFYNIAYHLNYLEHEDSKNRSKEISVLMSMPLVASLLSPFFGGLIINIFDYSFLYVIGAILLSLSILPLFATKDKKENIKFKTKDLFKDIAKKENRNLSLSFMGYASATIIGIIIWPIFLTSLSISAKSIGIIMSSAAIITLILFLFIKEKEDIKTEEKEIKKRTILHTIGWIGRIFADSVFLAFLIDSYKKITFRLLSLPWTSYTYNIAKKRHDYFRFIVSREITFNLSRVLIIPILIWFFNIGFAPFTLSFILAAFLSTGYSLIIKNR